MWNQQLLNEPSERTATLVFLLPMPNLEPGWSREQRPSARPPALRRPVISLCSSADVARLKAHLGCLQEDANMTAVRLQRCWDAAAGGLKRSAVS